MSVQATFNAMIDGLGTAIMEHLVECPDGATQVELQDRFLKQALAQRELCEGMSIVDAMADGAILDSNALAIVLARTYVSVAIEQLVQRKRVQLIREFEKITADGHMPQPYKLDVREVYRPTYECWLEAVS